MDIGQFVNPGSKLGRIQAIDAAEVHLPIPTHDLAFLDVPLDFSPLGDGAEGSAVTLTAEFGGQTVSWPARLVRTDGEIDLKTRTLNVVARVEDPYNRGAHLERVAASERAGTPPGGASEAEPSETPTKPSSAGPPLPSGLFVSAEIAGRNLSDVFVLPLAALRDGDAVFVVDEDGALDVRAVEILRRDRDHVVVGSGVAVGDRIIVSPLPLFSRGMSLRAIEDTAP